VSVPSRRSFAVAALLAGGIAAAPLVAVPALAVDGGKKLSTTLTGAAEVPKAGDPDGSGEATVRVNIGQGEVCYTLKVEGIAPAAAAHIHEAPAGVAADVTRELAKEIAKNPENYYVNVHNMEFPGGALRGQLG
jgi:hypothetical protein